MRINLLWMVLGVVVGSAATYALAQTPTATYRVPQFENGDVKVWKTVILPKSPLSMHRHEHGRALVALKGGQVTIQNDKGKKTPVVWETGKAYWLDADPPGNEQHADVNEGTDPIEVIVVELKNDRK
ncbi:MAG: hypothetical protein U0Q12_13985 [Vicinamibacterales bacterium]